MQTKVIMGSQEIPESRLALLDESPILKLTDETPKSLKSCDSEVSSSTPATSRGSSRIPRLTRSASLSLPGTIQRDRKTSGGTDGDSKRRSLSTVNGSRWHTEPTRKSYSYAGISPSLSRKSLNLALSKSGFCPHTPTPSPEGYDDDLDSVKSFGSACSSMSCDHAIARNGTTFSGRKMRYVVHCSAYSGNGEEYLTPTQRADKKIRRLKELLSDARKDNSRKDHEIFKLTKELVELRLYKTQFDSRDSPDHACPSTPAQTGNTMRRPRSPLNIHSVQDIHKLGTSPDLVVRDCPVVETSEESVDALEISGIQVGLKSCDAHTPSSLVDSGHFDDLTSHSVHSKESLDLQIQKSVTDIGLCTDLVYEREEERRREVEERDIERRKIIELYEKKIEEMKRNHVDEYQEMKEKYNDKVEDLLQKLSEANTRYCELRVQYDEAVDHLRELERQIESLQNEKTEQERKHQSMYLKMYVKGQEAAKFEHADEVVEIAHSSPQRIAISELLQQLHVTEKELEKMKALYHRTLFNNAEKSGEIDPQITLQFLKSAIFYFLTDKENHSGHLKAIESILGYSDFEKLSIEKACKSGKK